MDSIVDAANETVEWIICTLELFFLFFFLPDYNRWHDGLL